MEWSLNVHTKKGSILLFKVCPVLGIKENRGSSWWASEKMLAAPGVFLAGFLHTAVNVWWRPGVLAKVGVHWCHTAEEAAHSPAHCPACDRLPPPGCWWERVGHSHRCCMERAGRRPAQEGEVSTLGFWGDLVSPGNQGDSMQGFSQSNSALCCLCITSSLKNKRRQKGISGGKECWHTTKAPSGPEGLRFSPFSKNGSNLKFSWSGIKVFPEILHSTWVKKKSLNSYTLIFKWYLMFIATDAVFALIIRI